jgi:hypothetical protein
MTGKEFRYHHHHHHHHHHYHASSSINDTHPKPGPFRRGANRAIWPTFLTLEGPQIYYYLINEKASKNVGIP